MTFHIYIGNVIIPTDEYFSEGLKPPTSISHIFSFVVQNMVFDGFPERFSSSSLQCFRIWGSSPLIFRTNSKGSSMAIPSGFWTMMGTSQGGTNVHMGLFEVYQNMAVGQSRGSKATLLLWQGLHIPTKTSLFQFLGCELKRLI